MNTKLEKLQDKIDKLNAEIRSSFHEALKEAADEIFLKYPKLENFSWTQYTPYFNDGEPCEFGINGDIGYQYGDLEIQNYSSAVKTWMPGVGSCTPELIPGAEKEFGTVENAQNLENELNKFINNLCKMESHVRAVMDEGRIIVSREGIETEDWDHD